MAVWDISLPLGSDTVWPEIAGRRTAGWQIEPDVGIAGVSDGAGRRDRSGGGSSLWR